MLICLLYVSGFLYVFQSSLASSTYVLLVVPLYCGSFNIVYIFIHVVYVGCFFFHVLGYFHVF